MSEHLSKLRLLFIGFGFVCMVFLVAGAWAATHRLNLLARPAQQIQPSVTNRTNALGVVSVKKVGDGVLSSAEVTLVNQSTKNIVAYTLVVGDGGVTSWTSNFAPGDTRVERISLGDLESAAEHYPHRAGEIRITAVYQQGGTSEGGSPYVNRLTDRMLGIKEETELVLPLLRKAQNSAESEADRSIEMLESEVASLSTHDKRSQSSPYREAGRNWIREKLRREIQEIKKKKLKSGSISLVDLVNLSESYQRLFAEL